MVVEQVHEPAGAAAWVVRMTKVVCLIPSAIRPSTSLVVRVIFR